MGNALKPNHAFNPAGTGTSTYAARYDDARIVAVDGVDPQASPEVLGTTTNLSAIAGSYADLPAARTSVNTLKGEVEARLDAIEAKLDALIEALEASGVLT